MDGANHGARHRFRIAGCARHLVGGWADGRTVDDDAAVDVEPVLFDGADDADDRHGRLRIVPEPLADRIAVGPEALRELLVDDGDRTLGVGEVGFRERPALQQRNLHRAEIVGRHAALVDLQLLPGLRHPAFDVDAPPADR